MGLGTKNRQKQTADICKQHLREKYRDKLGLVEEFIVEFEGARKDCDITRWGQFTDIKKTLKMRCLRVSRRTSRSGLIREFNETRAEHLRIIRCEIPAHEEIYGFSPESLSLSMSRCALGSIPTGSAVAGSSSSSPKARVGD